MATGAAAAQAGKTKAQDNPHKDDDRGPGSLAGNLTADIDLRFTHSGTAVTNLRVASSERTLNSRSNQWEDGPTVFYDVQCWGVLATNCAEWLQKGDRIVAEGRWVSNTWEDKEGNTQERIVLRARDLGPSMAFRGARVERKRDGK